MNQLPKPGLDEPVVRSSGPLVWPAGVRYDEALWVWSPRRCYSCQYAFEPARRADGRCGLCGDQFDPPGYPADDLSWPA